MSFLNRNTGPESNIAKSIRALKLDLEIYEEQLKNEFHPNIKEDLREKIKKTREEIETMENVDIPEGNILMNGLKNNISEISILIDHEPDIKKREALQQQQLECINALATREKPISKLEELNDAVDQIESDERIIQRWYSRSFDQVDLELLLKSDMIAFFDTADRQALEKAFGQMLINDNTKSILGKNDNLYAEVEEKWEKHEKEVESSIRNFQVEEDELRSRFAEAKPDEKQRIRNRMREIGSILKNSQEEIKSGRSSWIHRERTIMEKAATPNVLNIVNPETMNMIASRIREAQFIRMEKIQEYLKNEFEKLEDTYKKHKKKGVFSPETEASYEAELAEAKDIIVDHQQTDPAIIRKLAENFEAARIALEGEDGQGGSVGELREVGENRGKIEARVLSDYKRLQEFMENLSPENKAKILESSKSKLSKLRISELSAIGKKELNGVEQLSHPDTEFRELVDEFTTRLENISEISNEELIAIKQDLDVLMRGLNTFDAELAHQTIEALEDAQTNEDIQRILQEYLNEEVLSIVTNDEFKAECKGFTPEGDMVMQEDGNDWRIIINEKIFREKTPEEIKKQLIHELLHVEFEKHQSTKYELRQQLINSDPEHWERIRNAFVEKENGKGKKAPDGKPWKTDGSHDNEILSELYAMQNELPSVISAGNSPSDRLNNLLVDANLAQAVREINNKTKKYKKDNADKKTFGYSAGADDDDDNDESYTDVSTLTPEEASFQANKEKIESLQNRMKELKETGYLGMVPGAGELINAMEEYNDGTADLNDDLQDDKENQVIATAITSRIDQVDGDLSELEDQVGKAARKAPNNEISIFRKLWLNTTFLSMEDFVQMGTDAYEFFQRRHKRKVADHAAKLGMALFSGTDLGREANARSQKAEAEEVNEWKSRYENLDAWQLMDELRGIAKAISPNKDQVKAILRILADKGRLEWRNEDLWTVLNKLQSAVILKPGDPLLLHNPVLLRQRMHRALGEIYDFDEFTSLERTNEGSYQSEKGKYDSLHSRMQDKLTGRLDELLAQARDGEQVEPMLYESIIEYSIKNGKSYAENVMFHLMAGMAEGILAPDRGLALGDHLNAWPAVDWFSTMSPPMSRQDWKNYCKKHFGKSFRKGSIDADGYGDDFKNWYWTTVQNNNRVIERVKKSVGERGWDHDWGRSIAPLGDAREAKKFFSGRSGQEETKITAVSNAYVGATMWLEENAKTPQSDINVNKKNFARIAGWIAMSEGMLDGTAYRESSKDINTRADEALNNDVPRESVYGRHGGDRTIDFRRRCMNYLMMLDEGFFSILTGREARSNEIKEELGARCRDYLSSRYPRLRQQLADVTVVDQIYDRIDLIISAIFDQMDRDDPGKFQRILSDLALAR